MYKFYKAISFFFCYIFFITAFTHDSYSQERLDIRNIPHYDYRPYHFGFLLGLNEMDFALKPVENLYNLHMSNGQNFDTLHSVLPKPEYGFNIGIVSNLKLGSQLDLRFIPTLSFGDRNITYEGVNQDGSIIKRNQKIESTFLDFPLHFKYKSVRMTNTRVYVLGGIKYSHDLASADENEDPVVRISKNDFYYELGVGFDYYFYYFKFSTELKASFGVIDMLKEENTVYTNSIDRLNSQIIQLSFLFE